MHTKHHYGCSEEGATGKNKFTFGCADRNNNKSCIIIKKAEYHCLEDDDDKALEDRKSVRNLTLTGLMSDMCKYKMGGASCMFDNTDDKKFKDVVGLCGEGNKNNKFSVTFE